MLDILERLCVIDGTSGDECAVRDFIINEIKDYCDYEVDNLGNLICFKKGKKESAKKIMIDAHTDEIGFIIKSVTADGFLKFQNVGGIDTAVIIGRKVLINSKVYGVIGLKPVHLCGSEERNKLPDADSLYIDIGASSRKEAESLVSVGDRAVMCSCFVRQDDKIISKAIDDRIGCAILIDLIKTYNEYDFYATFTVQEEVGARGAKVAAFNVKPDSAIVLEATTASDITGIPPEKTVCTLGKGVAVSFMDKGAVYDREYYNALINSDIKCQPKSAVAGGNNSSTVHLSGKGVRTIALSVPCRYIHSANSVADVNDILSARTAAEYILEQISNGNIK